MSKTRKVAPLATEERLTYERVRARELAARVLQDPDDRILALALASCRASIARLEAVLAGSERRYA